MKYSKPFAFILLALLPLVSACGGARYAGVAQSGWDGDTIVVHLQPASGSELKPGKVEVECLTCNYVEPPLQLVVNADGTTKIFYPEAHTRISLGMHLHANGFDSALLVKQRPPKEAEQFFHLSRPLTGRLITSQLAMLYSDGSMNEAKASANKGEELNIYIEQGDFYVVHHPLYSIPLYILKTNAVRLY